MSDTAANDSPRAPVPAPAPVAGIPIGGDLVGMEPGSRLGDQPGDIIPPTHICKKGFRDALKRGDKQFEKGKYNTCITRYESAMKNWIDQTGSPGRTYVVRALDTHTADKRAKCQVLRRAMEFVVNQPDPGQIPRSRPAPPPPLPSDADAQPDADPQAEPAVETPRKKGPMERLKSLKLSEAFKRIGSGSRSSSARGTQGEGH